jgi:ribose transport system ATP-binding protein
LIGATPVDSGSVTVIGVRRHITSPRQALRLGLGMLPESRKEDGLVMIRTVGENIGYALVGAAARWMIVPWRSIRSRVRQIVENVGVRPPHTNVQVANLSGGNQQKVVLGKWLAAGSEVLVLDEPTRGVDVGARADIYRLMQQLKEDGKAILMISSDMTEILTQSDRILVMAQGRVVGELAGAEATEEKVLSLALGLGEAA